MRAHPEVHSAINHSPSAVLSPRARPLCGDPSHVARLVSAAPPQHLASAGWIAAASASAAPAPTSPICGTGGVTLSLPCLQSTPAASPATSWQRSPAGTSATDAATLRTDSAAQVEVTPAELNEALARGYAALKEAETAKAKAADLDASLSAAMERTAALERLHAAEKAARAAEMEDRLGRMAHEHASQVAELTRQLERARADGDEQREQRESHGSVEHEQRTVKFAVSPPIDESAALHARVAGLEKALALAKARAIAAEDAMKEVEHEAESANDGECLDDGLSPPPQDDQPHDMGLSTAMRAREMPSSLLSQSLSLLSRSSHDVVATVIKLPLEEAIEQAGALVCGESGALKLAGKMKREEHVLGVILAVRSAFQSSEGALLIQSTELWAAVGSLVDLIMGDVMTAKRRALMANRHAQEHAQELIKQGADAALDLTEQGLAKRNELCNAISTANTENTAAARELMSALQEQQKRVQDVVKKALGLLHSGESSRRRSSEDEVTQPILMRVIHVAAERVLQAAVKERSKKEELDALVAERNRVAQQPSEHTLASRSEVSSTTRIQHLLRSHAALHFSDPTALVDLQLSKGHGAAALEEAEREWESVSIEAERAISGAQAKLRGQQQALLAAREALMAARSLAAAEEPLEHYDPELDEATRDASAKLQHIETVIRGCHAESLEARKYLNEAGMRSRQNKRGSGVSPAIAPPKGGSASEPAQTTAEKRQVQLDSVAQQCEKLARDLSSGDGQWNVEDWLGSLKTKEGSTVLGVVAKALQARRTSEKSPFEYVKSLQDVEAVLTSTDFVRMLARIIEEGVGDLAEQVVPDAQQVRLEIDSFECPLIRRATPSLTDRWSTTTVVLAAL